MAVRRAVWLYLVSLGPRRVAALLLRLLVTGSIVRLDVGRHRCLVLAHAPLRAMGIHRRNLVLDPRPGVGAGMGLMGDGARLRELVSARLRRAGGLRPVDPWVGWIVVPRSSFGYGSRLVQRSAIAPYALPRTTPFIVQGTAPVAV